MVPGLEDGTGFAAIAPRAWGAITAMDRTALDQRWMAGRGQVTAGRPSLN